MSEKYIVKEAREIKRKTTDFGEKVDFGLLFEGQEQEASWFTSATMQMPSVGDELEGTLENSEYGLKFRMGGPKKGGGGFKGRSPGETKAIQRQHSQHMMLLREANMIAAGHRPYTGEQMVAVTNFFDQDIAGKDRAITWDGMTDDVPADQTDLPFAESST